MWGHKRKVGEHQKNFGLCPPPLANCFRRHWFVLNITQKRMIAMCSRNDLEIPWKSYCFGFKGQGHSVSKLILHTRTPTLHTRTAINQYSLDGVTSRLRFCGCLVRALLTFARWHNHLSVWVRSRDRVPSS